jgi:hypothetical protein
MMVDPVMESYWVNLSEDELRVRLQRAALHDYGEMFIERLIRCRDDHLVLEVIDEILGS